MAPPTRTQTLKTVSKEMMEMIRNLGSVHVLILGHSGLEGLEGLIVEENPQLRTRFLKKQCARMSTVSSTSEEILS